MRSNRDSPRDDVCRAIADGIAAAHPRRVIDDAVSLAGDSLHVGDAVYPLDEYDHLLVLGGGNAAGTAAAALESVLGGRIDDGLVVTDDPVETEIIELVAGTHPLPSDPNVTGTEQLLARARAAGERTLALVVLTGGGSALLAKPAAGIDLDSSRELTDDLVTSGATIAEINAVRKHLSEIKGGQLAAELAPATTVGLLFSDVVGNRRGVIASGPISPDETTYSDARAVIDRYDFEPPDSVRRILAEGEGGNRPETPNADDPSVAAAETHILADNRAALDAAADSLREAGYRSVVLAADIEGEAREVGGVHAAIANQCRARGEPFEPPVALLSGGETTVTVDGDGTGGPNQEFALAAALDLRSGVVTAIDTDGIDGSTDVAGAILDSALIDDEGAARAALENNDSFPFLRARNAQIETGQTGTNVNDLRILLVGGPEAGGGSADT